MLAEQSVIADIKAIILKARDRAVRLVDFERTLMYWQNYERTAFAIGMDTLQNTHSH